MLANLWNYKHSMLFMELIYLQQTYISYSKQVKSIVPTLNVSNGQTYLTSIIHYSLKFNKFKTSTN